MAMKIQINEAEKQYREVDARFGEAITDIQNRSGGLRNRVNAMRIDAENARVANFTWWRRISLATAAFTTMVAFVQYST